MVPVPDLTQVLSVQHLSQVGGSVTVDNCAASVLASHHPNMGPLPTASSILLCSIGLFVL